MIVPAGRPIWSRTATMQTYGGDPDKHDYAGIGAVNARTDVTAAQYCRLAEDAASLAITAPLFRVRIVAVAGSPGTFNITQCRTLWGSNTDVAYAGASPAAGFPSAVNVSGVGPYPVGAGGFTLLLTIPTEAADAFGVIEPIVVRDTFCDAYTKSTLSSGNALVFNWTGAAGSSAIVRGF